jgi:hypothetical protein
VALFSSTFATTVDRSLLDHISVGMEHSLNAPDLALDFFSGSFDPLRALLAVNLRPPVPAARPLDNVARCRFMLPPDHPDAWQDSQKRVKSKVGAWHSF